MNKQAVIFDMDGVISDTQKFHAQVESQILKDYGIDMSPSAITHKYAGVDDKKMFEEIFNEHQIQVPSLDEVVFKKWDLMAGVIHGNIKEIPFASQLIKTLHQRGFKLAIASASTKEFILQVVKELDLSAFFEAIVSAQEVPHGKPAPDIFLLAASRLSVSPDQTVVIEDGRSGMIAAEKAGMKSIGLVPDISADYPATKLVTSLKDITIPLINSL